MKKLKKDFCLICEQCFNNKEIPLPRNLKRENFEISTVYNLFSKEKINLKLIEKIKEQKWTPEENKKLMESMKKIIIGMMWLNPLEKIIIKQKKIVFYI